MGQRVRDYTFSSVVVLLFDAVGKLQVFLPPATLKKVSWGIWPCLTLLENLTVSCFSGSHIEADYMGCMSAYL